jgi:hypothetical protein
LLPLSPAALQALLALEYRKAHSVCGQDLKREHYILNFQKSI